MKEACIDMKETDITATTHQMARGVSNNIKMLNTLEQINLLQSVNEENELNEGGIYIWVVQSICALWGVSLSQKLFISATMMAITSLLIVYMHTSPTVSPYCR